MNHDEEVHFILLSCSTIMQYTLQNEVLRVRVHQNGAELTSIFRTDLGWEYLWGGDPRYWGRQSPVLFPIVGALQDKTYYHQGHAYTLPQHGFARDRTFELVEYTPRSIQFVLRDDADTRLVYPFAFALSITYRLEGDTLSVTYQIENPGTEVLPCSVGAHPAFRVPLEEGLVYSDYHLAFGTSEHARIYPINAEGLLLPHSVPFLEHTQRLPLDKSLFYGGALVFKALASETISLRSDQSPHGLTMDFAGFPYFGIWAARDADFVCLEPWQGIADTEGASQDIADKEGMVSLPPGEAVAYTWRVSLF